MVLARLDQYVAIPCAGYKPIKRKPNHTYLIESPGENRKKIGWMDLEEAQKRFEIGPENIFVSNSHAACPNCYQARMDEFNRLDKIKI